MLPILLVRTCAVLQCQQDALILLRTPVHVFEAPDTALNESALLVGPLPSVLAVSYNGQVCHHRVSRIDIAPRQVDHVVYTGLPVTTCT